MSTSSSFIWDEESRDLLLFDYLEGNLSEEKTAQLQQSLAADPALQAELSSWQASVVVDEAFYPTGKLEAALLKIPQMPPRVSYTGLAWSVVLLLLLSFVPAADKPLQSPPAQEEQQAQKLAESSQQQHPLPLPEAAPASNASSRLPQASGNGQAKLPIQAEPPAPLPSEAIMAHELPLLEPLSPLENEPQARLLLPLLPPLPATTPPRQMAPKQISRQQARQIRKMKEKALQQKQANEFIKGNRPYVVPLDTKNF